MADPLGATGQLSAAGSKAGLNRGVCALFAAISSVILGSAGRARQRDGAAVRDAQNGLRELANQLTLQLQGAQKDLAARTSLHSVQARLRAGGAETTAQEIADHVARLLQEGPTPR